MSTWSKWELGRDDLSVVADRNADGPDHHGPVLAATDPRVDDDPPQEIRRAGEAARSVDAQCRTPRQVQLDQGTGNRIPAAVIDFDRVSILGDRGRPGDDEQSVAVPRQDRALGRIGKSEAPIRSALPPRTR
jgi:hypothetical protein